MNLHTFMKGMGLHPLTLMCVGWAQRALGGGGGGRVDKLLIQGNTAWGTAWRLGFRTELNELNQWYEFGAVPYLCH